jgi:hypothetical protein
MPSPIPPRDRKVYFVGAGLSCALGLPNTPSLIEGVLSLAAHHRRWLISEQLPNRLNQAFRFFYPDAVNAGYRPDVVDFFSALRTYLDVGAGLAGGFHDAPELYRSLKFAIAHLLTERIRDCDSQLWAGHAYLDEVVQPGNIVITSNWDLVIERYAQIKDVPLRMSGYGEHELVLLKLHGSVDWCRGSDRAGYPLAGYPNADYCVLGEQLFGPRPYRMALPSAAQLRDQLIRIRALEHWSDGWRKITSRADDLHMVTMARGKAGDLGPLLPVWKDAYGAISRARTIEIVGYSLPPDDIEIRTLLRAGIQRGGGPTQLIIRNPAPDVHERARRYLRHRLQSNYLPVNSA